MIHMTPGFCVLPFIVQSRRYLKRDFLQVFKQKNLTDCSPPGFYRVFDSAGSIDQFYSLFSGISKNFKKVQAPGRPTLDHAGIKFKRMTT